jgi:hypothetical protein
VAKLADALDSKSGSRKGVWVRIPPSVPLNFLIIFVIKFLLQARRDQPKILNLCRAVAFLNQLQKDVKSYQNIEYIEASKEDINIAVELASEIIGMTLDDLSIPSRDLLEQLNEMLPQGKERHSSSFTRTDIVNYTGWTRTRLHIHLKELIDMELVVKLSGRKNSLQHYRLLYNSDQGKDGKRFMIGLNLG